MKSIAPLTVLPTEIRRQLDDWGTLTISCRANGFKATLTNEHVIKTVDGDTPQGALANLEVELMASQTYGQPH